MMQPVRVLVVDDSAFMRLTLSRRLTAEDGLEVVGTACDGYEALTQIQVLKPDVVTLDVEMPRLDGLGALTQIMTSQPVPIIMVSSLTREGTEITARALMLGAVDCIAKPSQFSGTQEMVRELAEKIRQAAGARIRPTLPMRHDPLSPPTKAKRPITSAGSVLVIGSSTGGPGALRQLLGILPADLNAATVIVQHMPAGFTRSLADHLNAISAWSVKEADAGDRLLEGQALLAPGGFHLIVNRQGEVSLTQDPPVNNVRPAVDVTMHSVVQAFGRQALGIILTGMGRDGTDGALAIRRAGGQVIAEAESTCAIYGMPRSVVEAGAADHVVPLPEIAGCVRQLLAGSRCARE